METNYFIKISYEKKDNLSSYKSYIYNNDYEKSLNKRISTPQEWDKVKSNGKYMIAGGVYNKKKGFLVLKAKDKEEAEKIASNNFVSRDKLGNYKKVNITMFTKI